MWLSNLIFNHQLLIKARNSRSKCQQDFQFVSILLSENLSNFHFMQQPTETFPFQLYSILQYMYAAHMPVY